MANRSSVDQIGDNSDRRLETDRFWVEVYWIAQCFSVAGFVVGYFWIAGAFSSQRNGSDADHSHLVGGLGWQIGIMPVLVATTAMTVLLCFLGWKSARVAGVTGALVIQSILGLALFYVLVHTSALAL